MSGPTSPFALHPVLPSTNDNISRFRLTSPPTPPPHLYTSKMPPRELPPRSSGRSLKKTKVIINVYDLLPPGRLSSFVWTIGCGLLHSGVVINEREYAFGGHDRRGLTGVYWTKPKTEPPGGTFRSEILHGFTYASNEEIEDIVREVRVDIAEKGLRWDG